MPLRQLVQEYFEWLIYNREDAQYKSWKTAEGASTHTYTGGFREREKSTGITESQCLT